MLSAFFFALCIIGWYASYKKISKQEVSIEGVLLVLLANACSIAAIYFPRMYFKNAPVIKVDGDYIWFNRKRYALSEIEHIRFSGKERVTGRFSGGGRYEAISMAFRNGELKHAFDTFYTNMYKIKQELYNRVDISKHSKLKPNIAITAASTQDATYKTSQFKSFRGIILWIFISCAILGIIVSHKQILSATYFILTMLLFHSIWMYYPSVKGECLIIKNHNFLWVNRKFKLNNIKECVFDTYNKWPNCLRVITKDFKQYHYPCCTLRDKQWIALKKHIESKGIPVRNECIFEGELPRFFDI